MSFNLVPIQQVQFDARNVTSTEYLRTMSFVETEHLICSNKTSPEELRRRLDKIGDVSSNHKNYTFMCEEPDVRHIFVKELNAWFSYI
jgi:hypothetical protein